MASGGTLPSWDDAASYVNGHFLWPTSTETFLYSPANHLFTSEQYHFENLRSEPRPGGVW